MRIGDLALRTDVSADTIRHYERLGLLRDVGRTDGGFRTYQDQAVSRVLLVRAAVAFGFSLKELRGFLAVRDRGGAPCRAVRNAAALKLQAIDRQIRALTSLRSTLDRVLVDWDARLAGANAGTALHLLDDLPSLAGPRAQASGHHPGGALDADVHLHRRSVAGALGARHLRTGSH